MPLKRGCCISGEVKLFPFPCLKIQAKPWQERNLALPSPNLLSFFPASFFLLSSQVKVRPEQTFGNFNPWSIFPHHFSPSTKPDRHSLLYSFILHNSLLSPWKKIDLLPTPSWFAPTNLPPVWWQCHVWGVQTEVIPNSPKEATFSRAHTFLFPHPNIQQGSALPKHKDKLSHITQCHRLEIWLLSGLWAQSRACRSSTLGQQRSGSELQFPVTGTGPGITRGSQETHRTHPKSKTRFGCTSSLSWVCQVCKDTVSWSYGTQWGFLCIYIQKCAN